MQIGFSDGGEEGQRNDILFFGLDFFLYMTKIGSVVHIYKWGFLKEKFYFFTLLNGIVRFRIIDTGFHYVSQFSPY